MAGVTASGAPSQLYQLVPLQEGSNYQGLAGQIIDSVIIDNITPSWLFVKCANRSVPPLTWGVVFKAVAASNDEGLLWQTPPGIQAAATTNKGTAQVIFTDRDVAESAGVSLITPSQAIHLANSGGASSVVVTPPPGSNSLIIVDKTSNATNQWSVVGVQTGVHYLNVSGLSTAAFCAIDLASDTSYTVASGTTTNFNVDASFVVQAVSLNSFPASPGVFLINQSSGLPLIGQALSANSLPVVLPSDMAPLSVASAGFTDVNVNLDEMGGAKLLEGFFNNNGVVPARGIHSYNTGPGTYPGTNDADYLQVQPRPTFFLTVGVNIAIATTGTTLVAAPSSVQSWVIRWIAIAVLIAPATATAVKIGTVAGGSSLGVVIFQASAAGAMDDAPPIEYGDFLIGTNLPIILTSTTTIGNAYVTICYSEVTTTAWPLG